MGGTHFRWQENLRIGDENIDSQHQGFFEACERIARHVEAGGTVAALGAQLKEMVVGIDHHFTCEEEYLHQIGFPDCMPHRMEHLALRALIDDAMIRIDTSRQPEEFAVITRQMLLVLTEHILLEDMKIKAFLRKRVP